MDKGKMIHIRVNEETKEALKKIAEEKNISVNELIREIMKSHIDDKNKK